ncbi:MAG: 4-hydroxythreonine-4-phosphate dehydrogenase PdxA [Congregibacter sp.]
MSTSSKRPRLAISYGDPAGIGPDVVLQAALARNWPCELVVIGDRDLLRQRANRLGLEIRIADYPSGEIAGEPAAADSGIADRPHAIASDGLRVLHQPLAAPVEAGKPSSLHAGAILDVLRRATSGCMRGEFDALVTAPVSKSIVSDGGFAFSGHTEFLAELTNTQKVVMLLTADTLRVALVTTHLPLAKIPAAITAPVLEQTLQILHTDMREKFGLDQPAISVLGLNPHAGEDGLLGSEENEVITPCIKAARENGMNVSGPWPADTAFNPKLREQTDVYLAMYHDQGLPVLKYASFGHAVNITLGLPIIRTSVDHGTAFDLAGSGRADAGSCIAAIEAALSISSVKV